MATEASDLYGLPLERFVAERKALAGALRAGGRRDQAAAVAQLRKPSVAAWSVNQLTRTQRSAIGELFEAGDALGAAQADVLAGSGDGRALRAAVQRERAAVDALTGAARGLLTADGHELSAAVLDRVAETLHAAALDEQARESVREGRLERELRHVGFGPFGADAGTVTQATTGRDATKKRAGAKRDATTKGAATTAATRKGAPKTAAAEPAVAQRSRPEQAERRKAVRAAELDARRLADRAARALELAQGRRERAARAVRNAEQALGEAQAALGDADEALASARAEADATAERHRRAQEPLENG